MPRRRFELNASFLVSIIFLFIGVIFTVVGSGLGFAMGSFRGSLYTRGDVDFLPWIFVGIGVPFAAIGAGILIGRAKKNARIRRVYQTGEEIMATITSLELDQGVTVNGSCPCYLECHYTDPVTGKLHIFRSRSIWAWPAELVGRNIRVLVDRDDPSVYYVDVESMIEGV